MSEFQEMIKDFSDDFLVTEFGISRPTVARWRAGTSEPHPIMVLVVKRRLDGRRLLPSQPDL